MIKFKQFDVGDSGYEEQMEKFQIEHPQAEFLQITGGHMSPEQIWFKYDDDSEQPKLSIPKKIAEELLDEKGVNHTSYELMFYDNGDWSENLQKWMENTDKWWFIVDVYLAGKGLGVELVEVTDD